VAGLVLIHASPAGRRDDGQRGRAREMAWWGSSHVVLGPQEHCQLPFAEPGRHILRVAALGMNGAISDWTEIPGALTWNEPPPDEVLAALPVQANGPKDFAQPLYREDVDAGCTLARPSRPQTATLKSVMLAVAGGLSLLARRLMWRRRALATERRSRTGLAGYPG
jgi:hypothetical protein